MLFWTLAAITLALATFITFLPLFRQKSGWTPVALALVFAIPAASLVLYQQVGTPEALNVERISPTSVVSHTGSNAGDAEIDDLVTKLRSRLDESPESLEGWMLLARTLKTMQRFPEALEALETAKRIAPDDPFVSVELVEAQLFMSQGGMISSEMIGELQAALNQDPSQQKALWLMGVAAAQAGEDDGAISYWENLLSQVEPDSPIRPSVEEQITAARTRIGSPPTIDTPSAEVDPAPSNEPVSAPVVAESVEPTVAVEETTRPGDGWNGVKVEVVGAESMPTGTAEKAVLFIIVRSAGMAAGPPIGVRRIIGPSLPLTITLSDQDSMLQERQISTESSVQIQARLSLSGSPASRPGDWQSAPVTIALDSAKEVELVVDQQVE